MKNTHPSTAFIPTSWALYGYYFLHLPKDPMRWALLYSWPSAFADVASVDMEADCAMHFIRGLGVCRESWNQFLMDTERPLDLFYTGDKWGSDHFTNSPKSINSKSQSQVWNCFSLSYTHMFSMTPYHLLCWYKQTKKG